MQNPPETGFASRSQTESNPLWIKLAAEFLSKTKLRSLLISLAVLLPCFWHRQIEAGDLPSHSYNAWLALLIQRGQAPGLRIVSQSTNVLFDVVLTRLMSVVGVSPAEHIAVSLSVLLFFWGSFALVAALSETTPWSIAPIIAVVTYGFIFHQGLFNYYLSLALTFLAFAILLKARGWKRLAAVPFLALAWLGNPLPVFWALASVLYLSIARQVAPKFRLVPLTGALAGLLVLRYGLLRMGASWSSRQIRLITGADQVVVYGPKFFFLAGVLVTLACVCLVANHQNTPSPPRRILSPLVQVYLLCAASIFLLPWELKFPVLYAGLISERLSLIAAVLGCAILGSVRPEKWHFKAFGIFALIYLSLLYSDTRVLNRTERRVRELVSQLPPGQRVTAIITYRSSRLSMLGHIVDRACIDRCFSYANYEPASGFFRIRALSGNHIAVTNSDDSWALQTGSYIVKDDDVPLYQIYPCGPAVSDLCMRALKAGERNGGPAREWEWR